MSSSSDDSCVTKIRDQDERKESEEVEKSGNMEEGGKAGEDREEEEEEEEGEPTPARKTLYDTIVYINVGPAGDVRQHGIHRGLISQYSTYFKTCLESGFKESHEKVITLDDEDVATLDRFNAWLYTKSILHDDETPNDISFTQLFDLYIFAEKRLIPRLQNACIDAAVAKVLKGNLAPHPRELEYLWDQTLSKSGMRKLMIDMMSEHAHISHCFEGIDPPIENGEFLTAMILGLYEAKCRMAGQESTHWQVGSRYHVPEDDVS